MKAVFVPSSFQRKHIQFNLKYSIRLFISSNISLIIGNRSDNDDLKRVRQVAKRNTFGQLQTTRLSHNVVPRQNNVNGYYCYLLDRELNCCWYAFGAQCFDTKDIGISKRYNTVLKISAVSEFTPRQPQVPAASLPIV